jgi:7-dehydrocholesterol reductase
MERNGSSSKHRGPPPQSTNNTVDTEGNYHKAAAFQRHGLNWVFSEVLVPLFLVLIIPTLTFVIRFICVRFNGSTLAFVKWMRTTELNNSLTQIFLSQFVFSKFAFGVVLGFLAWAILMTKLLPGTTYQGPITLNGNRPSYKDNGLLYHVVTTIAFYCVAFYLESSGLGSVGMIYDRYDEILTALNTVGGLFCLVLYFKGIYWPTSTDNSTSGSVILDYYWGTELHPRMFGVDVKLITNCRFGMSAWFLLVNVFCWKCFVVNGFTDSILITNVLISLYLTKFFHWESGYMKTIDIVLDRAGFYLCYGCICWVPGK